MGDQNPKPKTPFEKLRDEIIANKYVAGAAGLALAAGSCAVGYHCVGNESSEGSQIEETPKPKQIEPKKKKKNGDESSGKKVLRYWIIGALLCLLTLILGRVFYYCLISCEVGDDEEEEFFDLEAQRVAKGF